MKKILFITLIFILTIFAGCSADTDNDENDNNLNLEDMNITEIAQSFTNDFLNKEFTKLLDEYNYTTEMNDAVSPKLYEELFTQLENDYGKYLSIKEYSNSESQGYDIITAILEFEKNYINLNIVFEGKIIAGTNYSVNKDYIEVENISMEQITFGKEPFVISGEINYPEGEGPFPVAIIVHGSGASDRDGSVSASTPYKDLSNGLISEGIAVLTYDKRTYTYGSEIATNIDELTVYEETIEDAGYAFEYLQENAKIDKDNISIIGHSFGGYLMPRIIENLPDAKAYIVMAGNVSGIEDLIITQYNYLFNLDNEITEEEKNQLVAVETEVNKINNLEEYKGEPILGAGYAYWKDLENYDPISKMTETIKPVLFLQGERDYQVTMEEFNKWKNALSGIDNFEFITYKSLNHLFIAGEGTPSPEEYTIGESVSAEVISDIAKFIKDNN